ncbi:MAG: alternative oxidase [Litorivicinaceae bacterium]
MTGCLRQRPTKSGSQENLNMAHRKPENISDHIALAITMALRFLADTFFKKRYGHRAVVLETVAGVPGMVAGMWQHLRSLRGMKNDSRGWIKTLLEEAENERMHLMIFIEIAKPNAFERYLILFAQAVFWNFYFVLYVFFPKIAHRMVGYFEEQAVVSYTQYLEEIDSGLIENTPAPTTAIEYYGLQADSTLRDVVKRVREDEEGHRDENHGMADLLVSTKGEPLGNSPQ